MARAVIGSPAMVAVFVQWLLVLYKKKLFVKSVEKKKGSKAVREVFIFSKVAT